MEQVGGIEIASLLKCLTRWRSGDCTDAELRCAIDAFADLHGGFDSDTHSDAIDLTNENFNPAVESSPGGEFYLATELAPESVESEKTQRASRAAGAAHSIGDDASERLACEVVPKANDLDQETLDQEAPLAPLSPVNDAPPELPETIFLHHEHDFDDARPSLLHFVLSPYYLVDDAIRCATLDYISLPKIAAVGALIALGVFGVKSIPEEAALTNWFDRSSEFAAAAEPPTSDNVVRKPVLGEVDDHVEAEDIESQDMAEREKDSLAIDSQELASFAAESVNEEAAASVSDLPVGLERRNTDGPEATSLEQNVEASQEQQAQGLLHRIEAAERTKLDSDELQVLLQQHYLDSELELLRAELLMRQETSEARQAAWRILIGEADGPSAAVSKLMLARLILESPAEDRKQMRAQFNTAIELFNPALFYLRHWLDVRQLGSEFDTSPIERAIAADPEESFCDCLFLANSHFTARRVDEALHCMTQAEAALKDFPLEYPTHAESWLAERSLDELSTVVDSTIDKLLSIQAQLAKKRPGIY